MSRTFSSLARRTRARTDDILKSKHLITQVKLKMSNKKSKYAKEHVMCEVGCRLRMREQKVQTTDMSQVKS